MKKHRYQALDGWRGIAALIIAMLHSLHIFLINHDDIPFMKNGYLVVDFFFVLSGLVIAQSYQARLLNGEVSLKSFMWRRFLRLWPLHIATTILVMSFEIWRDGYNEAFHLVALLHQIFLLQSVVFSGKFIMWNHPNWSISVEFYTYLVFGALFLLKKPNIKWILLLSVFLLTFIAIYNDTGGQRPGIATMGKYGIFRCIAEFGIGVVLCNILPRVRPILNRMNSTALELGAIGIVFLFIQYLGRGQITVAVSLPFFFFVMVFAMERGVISRILCARPFQLLGELSYSIYLTHIFVIGVLQLWLYQNFIGLFILPPCVIAFSYLTHRFIEAPFYK